ncbi:MAG: DUF937 domain-containing protein [Saprospiraceae bacterium]|mgnify:FL=1
MDLMSMLQQQLSGDTLSSISQQVGASEEQTTQASNGIFAALLGGLANNASTPQGLESLSAALDKDHDGSVLDDLLGLVTGSSQANPRATNGTGMLGHILGNNQEQVAQQISQSSGLNMGQIMKLMPILAPIVMAVIGRMKNNAGNANSGMSGSVMFDLAKILMGSAQSAASQGGFGDLIGSVLGGVMGQQAQSSQQATAGGGLLGTIFGKLFKK